MRQLTELDRTAMTRFGSATAGVDEVGYSALAGPLCACALVLKNGEGADVSLPDIEVDDSKLLKPATREILMPRIRAATWSAVAWVTSKEINRIKNIQMAAKLAMARAVTKLWRHRQLDGVIVDHYQLDLPVNLLAEDKADARSFIVACASIVAKVTRDKYMRTQHRRWPQYGFNTNVGYRGRGSHLRAIQEHGPCPLHRLHLLGELKGRKKL